MALSESRRAWIGTILFLLANPAAAQKPADLTAVLARVEGQVTLSSDTRAQFRSIRPAAQRQVIRRGETVHVPSGASLDLICSTDTLVSLKGPMDWVFDATACGRGLVLPESSYQNLAPHAGRLLSRRGVLLLEFETRNWDGEPGPILLSPRDTAVTNSRPALVWTRVPGAVEYEIALRGPVSASIRVAAGDLRCGRDLAPWHDLEVCSWSPSEKWPSLEPGKAVSLKLGDRQTLTAPLRQANSVSELRLLSVSEQNAVQESVGQIATLSIDKATRLLLTAGVYVQGGLYSDAIATYDEALRAQEAPEARVTLGDLYLAGGLTVLAGREYRQVLEGSPDPAVRAAAELGLGFVAYFRKRFSDAQAHFERAREIYATAGLPVEAEEAGAAALRAQAPTGNAPP
jgi:hypothetical protein